MNEENKQVAENSQHDHPVEIQVNGKPVQVSDHKVTGLQIKEAAINQGIPIQVDFVLFNLGKNPMEQITDSQVITVHVKQAFRAVSPDDKS